MTMFSLIATTAFGLESVVARELQQLGYETKNFNGYVEFSGDESAVIRANLWLRSADRVLIKIGQFHADTFDALFEQTKHLPWAELLPRDANFPVEGRSVKSQLASVRACQSIVKKAIVDGLSSKYRLVEFPETGPRFSIEVSLQKDEAMLTVDTSGAALHKRGYRQLSVTAPIKETLAAALVQLSRWQAHRPFADPMCGSGTIAIEAAMLAQNAAPGLRRMFDSEHWPNFAGPLWKQHRESAKALLKEDIEVDIFAGDVDAKVLSLAEYHVRKAGVGKLVRLKQQNVADFHPQTSFGCVVTNPPYGERLGERKEAQNLYHQMGQALRSADTWSVFVIASHPAFEKYYGKPASQKRKLYNGRIQTNLYQYLGPLPPRSKSRTDAPMTL
ncbi:class I SAM-dependent RNA methyltransferase [Alicyclobacillaceae bacterium I2511]|nr:class I SAM-dependent RNA methyltransferase [Alicyclobacillaceae bacterium I2511]